MFLWLEAGSSIVSYLLILFPLGALTLVNKCNLLKCESEENKVSLTLTTLSIFWFIFLFFFWSESKIGNSIIKDQKYKTNLWMFFFCDILCSRKKLRSLIHTCLTFCRLMALIQLSAGRTRCWYHQSIHSLNNRLDYRPESTFYVHVSLVVIATKPDLAPCYSADSLTIDVYIVLSVDAKINFPCW